MKIDSQFSSLWRTYALQSVYASIAVFFITLVLGMEHAVVIASIGATSFIVFAMPNNVSGQPKRIIGGHLLGFFVGSCFAVFPLMDFLLFGALWHALAVGIANTMNDVAPMLVITTACSIPSTSVIKNTAIDAYTL